ncbi:MAG TPA: hypothetical protein VMD28_01330, partial [Acidimicrobiales bacterium]|nr:hypothetical protein [Acidimicrobiales bacterium]
MNASGSLILTGGTIVDPASGRTETGDVTVAGGRIASLGGGTGDAPPGARRVDCAGAYVVPGLIDSHSHVFR